ncbi:MAG: Uma2 family endonuclease [Candidatus Methylomirabilales bacterium]
MKAKIPLTAKELFEMGDIGPCELVKGELIMMSPTGARYGKIAAKITRIVGTYVEAHPLGVVCTAEAGFLLSSDPDMVRAPDVAFVSKKRIPPEGEPDEFWPFAPDLAVEVVSPTDRWSDIEAKGEEYLQAGTGLVWVVDPKTKTVHAYRLPSEVQILHETDTLTGGEVLPGFQVAVAELFV